MNDLPQDSPLAILNDLNATQLSQHLASPMREEEISPNPDSQFVGQVVYWATENLAGDPALAQAVDNAVGLAQVNDPRATYVNLANCFEPLGQAQTLREAGL